MPGSESGEFPDASTISDGLDKLDGSNVPLLCQSTSSPASGDWSGLTASQSSNAARSPRA